MLSQSRDHNGEKGIKLTGMGLDYDFKSVYLLQHSIYPLVRLHSNKIIRVYNIKVYVSPSGSGWHVRFDVMAPSYMTRREIELIGGDDIGRHVVSLLRGDIECSNLFEVKTKNGEHHAEKYAPEITRRVKEQFKRGW